MTRESRSVDLNTTAGTGQEFAPPEWLADEFVRLARPGRVTADVIGSKPLPAHVGSINLPKVTGGSSATVQGSQGSSVSDTAATTSSVSSGIMTLSGQQSVALQLLEQADEGVDIDAMVLEDLAASYAVALDTQVLVASTPFVGLLNVSGVNNLTYTTGSPAVLGSGQFNSQIVQAVEKIATTRYAPATSIIMRPDRWSWIVGTTFDTTGRPLFGTITQGPVNALGVSNQVDGDQVATPVGMLQGLPVYTDPNIPTNLGAGLNQEVAFVLRESDLNLYETPPVAMRFDTTYAGSLEVLFRVHGYAAAIFNRYPQSIAVIGGTGLIFPPTW
jgi:HK97 family phage major capsid protein